MSDLKIYVYFIYIFYVPHDWLLAQYLENSFNYCEFHSENIAIMEMY